MTTLANKIRKWQTWQNETKQSENNSRGVAVVTSRCLQSIPLRWTHPLTSPLLSRSPWWYRKRREKSPKLPHKINVLKCVKSNTQNGQLQKLDYLIPRCSPRSTLSCSCDLPALLPLSAHMRVVPFKIEQMKDLIIRLLTNVTPCSYLSVTPI